MAAFLCALEKWSGKREYFQFYRSNLTSRMIFPILLIVSYSILQYNIDNKQGIFLDVIILLLICWIELRIQIIQARAQIIDQDPPARNNPVDP